MLDINLNPILLYSGYYDYDSLYPFIVDSNFYYITQCDIPNLIFLQDNQAKYIFFTIPNKNFHDTQQYMDTINSSFPEINQENYLPLGQLDIILDKLDIDKLYTLSNDNYYLSKINNHHQTKTLLIDTDTLVNYCLQLRKIKTKQEITNIRKACHISSLGIIEVLKNAKPLLYEYQLVNIFHNYMINNGNTKYAYQPICSHGYNNRILHYNSNDQQIIDKNSLVLMDIGCKYNYYCSDITRTYPINGKFTPINKKIYQIVLQVQEYSLTLVKSGIYWIEIENKTREKLYQLIQQEIELFTITNNISNIDITRAIMPHGLGHCVGLDVHDGPAIDKLEKDMVVTIEPGIYFNSHSYQKYQNNINKTIWDIYKKVGGIRIEDTILVTKNGYENLTIIPKDIKWIEKTIKGKKPNKTKRKYIGT